MCALPILFPSVTLSLCLCVTNYVYTANYLLLCYTFFLSLCGNMRGRIKSIPPSYCVHRHVIRVIVLLLLCLVPCTTFPFYHILQPGPWLQSRLPLGVVPAAYILVKDIVSLSVGGMIASRLPRLACECSQRLTRECSVDQMCGCNQCQALAERGAESHQIYSTFVKTCVS